MREIESILIVCRKRPTNEDDIYYIVGHEGVTKIKRNPGYNTYNVYKENEVIAIVKEPDEITYKI